MTVYERIKLEADKKDISLTYLADKAKLSPGAMNKWTSDNIKWNADNIKKIKGEPGSIKLFLIATELGCTMEYLLTGEKKFDSLDDIDIEWLNVLQLINQIPKKQSHECMYFVKKYIEAYIDLIAIQDEGGRI